MQVGEVRAELVAERDGERDRVALEDGHLVAERACGRSHLHPDPARPDEDEPAPAAGDRVSQADAVVHRPQVVHVTRIRSRNRQDARLRAGRKKKRLVPGHRTPVIHHRCGIRVQPHHARAQSQVDIVVAVPGGVEDVDGCTVVGSCEKAFRQRRADVGEVLFRSEEPDRSVVAFVAEGLCGCRAGQCRSDDDDGFRRGGHVWCFFLLLVAVPQRSQEVVPAVRGQCAREA